MTGPDGLTGTAGSSGVAGLTGVTGVAGLAGVTGVAGVAFGPTYGMLISLLILLILAESIWRIKVTIGNIKVTALWINPAIPKVIKFKNPSLMSIKAR